MSILCAGEQASLVNIKRYLSDLSKIVQNSLPHHEVFSDNLAKLAAPKAQILLKFYLEEIFRNSMVFLEFCVFRRISLHSENGF